MPTEPTAIVLQQRLIGAIEADSPDVAEAIAQGADPNLPLPNGATPLMWAIAHHKSGAVGTLLAAGADVHARDHEREVPLTIAGRFAPPGDASIVEKVLEAGADPNVRRPNGDPAITSLTRKHHLEGIAVMARHRADLDAKNRTGTPLVLEAALLQHWDVVHALIEHGADAQVVDGKLSVTKLLANHGATPPDSPLWPWKVKVWQHLAERGEPVPPLPDAS